MYSSRQRDFAVQIKNPANMPGYACFHTDTNIIDLDSDNEDISDIIEIKDNNKKEHCLWVKRISKQSKTVCMKSFTSKQKLALHIKKEHIDTQKRSDHTCCWRSCAMRNTIFFTSNSLQLHILCHTEVHPYACMFSACGKGFPNMYLLKNHEKEHFKQKSFKCLKEVSNTCSNNSPISKTSSTKYKGAKIVKKTPSQKVLPTFKIGNTNRGIIGNGRRKFLQKMLQENNNEPIVTMLNSKESKKILPIKTVEILLTNNRFKEFLPSKGRSTNINGNIDTLTPAGATTNENSRINYQPQIHQIGIDVLNESWNVSVENYYPCEFNENPCSIPGAETMIYEDQYQNYQTQQNLCDSYGILSENDETELMMKTNTVPIDYNDQFKYVPSTYTTNCDYLGDDLQFHKEVLHDFSGTEPYASQYLFDPLIQSWNDFDGETVDPNLLTESNLIPTNCNTNVQYILPFDATSVCEQESEKLSDEINNPSDLHVNSFLIPGTDMMGSHGMEYFTDPMCFHNYEEQLGYGYFPANIEPNLLPPLYADYSPENLHLQTFIGNLYVDSNYLCETTEPYQMGYFTDALIYENTDSQQMFQYDQVASKESDIAYNSSELSVKSYRTSRTDIIGPHQMGYFTDSMDYQDNQHYKGQSTDSSAYGYCVENIDSELMELVGNLEFHETSVSSCENKTTELKETNYLNIDSMVYIKQFENYNEEENVSASNKDETFDKKSSYIDINMWSEIFSILGNLT